MRMPATSDQGNPIELGVRPCESGDDAGAPPDAFAATVGARAPTGSLTVHWPVGNGQWLTAPPDVARILRISRYRLWRRPAPAPYDYTLDVATAANMSYRFYDASGDSYSLLAILAREHFVQFNSTNPTIIRVEYWYLW